MRVRVNQIDKDAYLDLSVLTEEREPIFFRTWHLAAMQGDLPNHNDFVVTAVGGRQVVIQNFQGRLSAFTNACSHRFSAIHNVPKGNRPLQCPYHLWSYDEAGAPRIPLRDQFSFVREADTERLALERWHLETCGTAIFVCLRPPSRSLRDSLGSAYDWLKAVSLNLGLELAKFESVIDANWKVIMQNTVEFYHAYSVHSDTFAPMMKLPPSIVEVNTPAPHIRYIAETKVDERTAQSQARLRNLFRAPPPMSTPGYEHLLIFPGLTVGHTNGSAYAFFQYTPIDAGHTLLTARQWLPAFSGEHPNQEAIANIVGDRIAQFTRRLSDEDKAICEAVQRGIVNIAPERRMCFSDGEFLVQRFHDYYLAELKRPGA
jgi:phenylpropionate dioxygenase-like ring-hydroxylating dioxygenase large terminal subunit